MARAKTTKKITKLFGSSAYDGATAKNYEGAPTFTRSREESLVRVLTTGTFEPTYYASDVTLADEALELFRSFAVEDPHFLAQAILYARNEGLMRIAPITALVMLSASASLDAKEMFRRIFPRVIQTPGDMQDFVSLCRGGKLRGMGKAVTHAVAGWLSSMSEYHAIKYGAESQSMSLRDLYRLSRPKLSATSSANAVARAIVRDDYSLLPEGSQLLGYQAFKKAAGEGRLEEALALVAEHRLPWEVVTGQFKGLTEDQQTTLWRTMLYQMPFMALLRNLNNLVKYHVTDDPEALDHMVRTLSDPERVAHSKQLPFRFYSAMKAITSTDAKTTTRGMRSPKGPLVRALTMALELSFASMPDLGANVLIANDISASMSSRPSARSDMTMAEIAGVFAAAAFKKAEQGSIVSFNQYAQPRTVDTSMSLADIAKVVSEGTGGTSLSAPLEYAFGEKARRSYDTAIFITDSESWYDHLTRNRGALDLIREYKKRVSSDLACFFVQLLPYKHAAAPQEEPGCFYLYGWNAGMLSYIAQMRSGGESQLEAVRQVSVL